MPYKQYLHVAFASLVFATLSAGSVTCAAAATNFKTIYAFHGPDGATPNPGLIRDSAGNFYGTTQSGGPYSCGEGCGTVFELSPTSTGWVETVLLDFLCGGRSGTDCPKGATPMAGLTFDSKGNLYGTTNAGGAYSHGTVFELSPSSDGGWVKTELYSFCALANCADGEGIFSGLIFDQQGNLYGATFGGGQGYGVVFELSPSAEGLWNESVLYAFIGGADGANPWGGLVADSAGNLYGTTFLGGAEDGTSGVAYELSNVSGVWDETVIHTFDASEKDGINPTAGMIFGPDGRLYGTTDYGGKVSRGVGIGFGTVFQLTPTSDGWTETVLLDFNGNSEGGQPLTGLAIDSSGNLYGTTSAGGFGVGVAFELQPESGGDWHEVLLHDFENGYDGGRPNALFPDPEGNLYGTAATGGAAGHGVVFEINEN